ncbi:MAG: hypothetical protein A3I05_00545 [Deltaproteobacteria bacterium RIFCSPLOWO2_02_FULL_44_10]|nr:MAG: hypothetical protein A3C46_01415 [Deltaproteobacteria bacterium RIFCSPHIGHO2_02_FULL_44_16]OGQ47291.1 MAG: hypothetical protein A3I05_00545 [Deltaproteobacteria bacterium RIFCSPLOWO2_02_FULL_44_10]
MKHRVSYAIFFVFLMGCFFFPSRRVETTSEHYSLFRYTGDGHLPVYNVHTKEHVDLVYRDAEGKYQNEALAQIDTLFACPFQQERTTISLRLIELLDHLQDHFGAQEIDFISGYRSPEYNAKLKNRNSRVAKYSMHLHGRAADIRLRGTNSRTLRNYAISLKAGGVGYYGRTQFVHVDTGPVRSWYR